MQVEDSFGSGGGRYRQRGRVQCYYTFIDLINISDLNYLTKNTVKDKRQGNYRPQISNLLISIHIFMQLDSHFLFVFVSSRGCVGVPVASLSVTDNENRKVGKSLDCDMKMTPNSVIS